MAQIPARKCGFCNNAVAALYCEDCHQILCVECRQNVHDKVPFLQDHKVATIQKEGNRVFRPHPVCEVHKNQFLYYCSKCECLTCAECITSNHNEHKTEKIKTVADTCRQTVIQYIEKIKTKVEIVKKKLETIDTEHSAQIQSDCKSYVATVIKTMGELYEIIDRYKVIHLTTASDFKDIENQDLERKKSFFKRLHDDTVDRLLKFENLLQETHDSTFLIEWKTLQTDVQISNEETDDPLVAPRRMESFNQSNFTRSVVDEFDEKFQMRLKEQEQTVVRLTKDMDALKDELEEKQEQISKLSRQLNEKEKKVTELLDENDKLKITLKERQLKELSNKLKEADEFCIICFDAYTEPRELTCGHVFCEECIQECFKVKPVCPKCGAIQGVIKGDQPAGKMTKKEVGYSLPGFTGCGTIEIEYEIYGGVQGEEHPNPGRSFKGIKRVAYFPNNTKGKLIADLLKIAFDRKLVFTIGHSRTTGQEGVVTWNDIHHKTSSSYGHQFGYPDEGYFHRVLDELKIKGVTEKDL